MKKYLLVLSLSAIFLSNLTFAADLSAVVLCKNKDSRPTDGASLRVDIYSDHKTTEGLVVSEYVTYKNSVMYVGKEAFYARVFIKGNTLRAELKNSKLENLEIDHQSIATAMTWRGQEYLCNARWDI